MVRALGNAGESVLIFLPGSGEIADLYEALLPLADGNAHGDGGYNMYSAGADGA